MLFGMQFQSHTDTKKNTLTHTVTNPQSQQLCSHPRHFCSRFIFSICSTPQKFHFSMLSWGWKQEHFSSSYVPQLALWSMVGIDFCPMNQTALFLGGLGVLPLTLRGDDEDDVVKVGRECVIISHQHSIVTSS